MIVWGPEIAKKRILLVHSAGGSATVWYKVAEALALYGESKTTSYQEWAQ